MAISEQEQFKFANEVGYEAFKLLVQRVEELGPLPFEELFPSLVAAATVCLANVLFPAVEASSSREITADQLSASCLKQVRALLERAVQGQP